MSNLEAKPAEVGIALAAEIRDGGKYLLGVDRNLTADQADQIQGVLRKRFPNSTFALMSPGLRVTTETVPFDLIGAVERARLKARENWLLSTHPETKVAYYGAMVGMELLKRELADTPERDGAGSLPAPASEPVEAPAPSRPDVPPAYIQPCGTPHPWMDNAWCTLAPHLDKRHEAQSVDTFRTVVRWTET